MSRWSVRQFCIATIYAYSLFCSDHVMYRFHSDCSQSCYTLAPRLSLVTMSRLSTVTMSGFYATTSRCVCVESPLYMLLLNLCHGYCRYVSADALSDGFWHISMSMLIQQFYPYVCQSRSDVLRKQLNVLVSSPHGSPHILGLGVPSMLAKFRWGHPIQGAECWWHIKVLRLSTNNLL